MPSFSHTNRLDVQSGHLWDSVSLCPDQPFDRSIQLFQLPIGRIDDRTGKAKTMADTNMVLACSLPAPEEFQIRRVLFTFSAASLEHDIYGVAESVVWSLFVGNKSYLRSPIIALQTAKQPKAPIRICSYCHAVYACDSICPGCGARDWYMLQHGEEFGLQFFMDVQPEITLPPQMYFKVSFECQPYQLKGRFRMWCHFEGLHARGIQ